MSTAPSVPPRIASVDLFYGSAKACLFLFKKRAVMVADDIVEFGLHHVAGHIGEMDETLVALGLLRHLIGREKRVQLHGDRRGVLHNVLRAARMDADAVHTDERRGRVEVFVFVYTELAAVHGVSPVARKLFNIQPLRAAADLLVGREHDAQLPVRRAGSDELFHRRHDLGNARFVVRAEQRGAVRYEQHLSAHILHGGELLFRENDAVAELNVLAGVEHLTGVHALAARGGSGVHMRDERERSGGLDALRGGKRADGVSAAVHMDVLQPQREHFLGQTARELQLPGRRRAFCAVLIGRGGHGDVFEKSFLAGHNKNPSVFELFFHISNISFL